MRVRHIHAPRWALATQLTYRCHLDQLLLAIADLFRLWAGIRSRIPLRPPHAIGELRYLTPCSRSTTHKYFATSFLSELPFLRDRNQ